MSEQRFAVGDVVRHKTSQQSMVVVKDEGEDGYICSWQDAAHGNRKTERFKHAELVAVVDVPSRGSGGPPPSSWG